MVKRLLVVLVLLTVLPLQPVKAASDTERGQIKARLATMKEQLRTLQEELARTKAEQALQQSTVKPAGRPGWLPLTAGRAVPTDYGRYAWVLFTAGSAPRDALTLTNLLNALPERGDLPQSERTLFLVPTRAPETTALTPESYDPFAETELLARFKTPGIELRGPLLLIGSMSRSGPSPQLLIDLQGRSATFFKQVLLLLRERDTPESDHSLLRRLIAVAGPEPTTVRDLDGALLVSWNR